MQRYKYLAKNVVVLTIGNFGTKFLTFLLVPLYTHALTTAEYGMYDIFHSTVSLLIPLLTLNISEAVLRFSIDESADKEQVLLCGIKLLLGSSLVVAGVLVLNHIWEVSSSLEEYGILFLGLYSITTAQEILNSYARGREQIVDVSIGGIIGTGTIILLNLVLLVVLKMGIKGYFLAHIWGLVVQCVYLSVRTNVWRIKCFKRNEILNAHMVAYSLPMIANSIGWWINNVSDRYVVTWLCGVATNGIYSVAYKIPSILQVFQSVFFQAWTLSAVKDFDTEDRSGFFTSMYGLYGMGMTCVCSILIIMSKFIARFMYANSFFNAWEYVPFLLVSVVFGALAGYLGGVYTAVKDSKAFAKSTAVGALVNLVLNVLLVRYIGAMGAAIATLISYFVVWIIRAIHVRKYIRIRINYIRDLMVYSLLILQGVVLVLMEDSVMIYCVEIGLFFLILVFYNRMINSLIKHIVQRMKTR